MSLKCYSGVFHFLSKQEPSIIRNLHTALLWIHSNSDLFSGKVTEPMFAGLNKGAGDSEGAAGDAVHECEDKDHVLIIF